MLERQRDVKYCSTVLSFSRALEFENIVRPDLDTQQQQLSIYVYNYLYHLIVLGTHVCVYIFMIYIKCLGFEVMGGLFLSFGVNRIYR